MPQATEELTQEEQHRFNAMRAYYDRLSNPAVQQSGPTLPKALQYAELPGRAMIAGAGQLVSALTHGSPLSLGQQPLGQKMQEFGAGADIDPDVRESGLGQTLSFAGGVVPAVGAFAVGGPLAAAGVMGEQGFQGAYERAGANGADEGHKLMAGLMTGGAAVALGLIPGERFAAILGRADAVLGPGKIADLAATTAIGGIATDANTYVGDAIAHSIGNDKDAADVLRAIKQNGVAPFLVAAGLHGVATYAKAKAQVAHDTGAANEYIAKRQADTHPELQTKIATPESAPQVEEPPPSPVQATPATSGREPGEAPEAVSSTDEAPSSSFAPTSEEAKQEVPAVMPKGAQIGTDLNGEPVYAKEERGAAQRPGEGIDQPQIHKPGLFDEQGGLFEQQAAKGTQAEVPNAEGEGFPWEKDQTTKEKLADPSVQYELRRMAQHEAGWEQEGGHLTFEPDSEGMRRQATGRTAWVPKAGETDWFERLPRNESGERATPKEIQKAVESAIAGKRLGKNQQAVVEHMLQFMEAGMAGRRFRREGPVPGEPSIVVTAKDLNRVTDSRGRTIQNIGYGMRGTAEDTTGSPNVQYRADVVQSMADVGSLIRPGFVVRIGGLPEGALGIYNAETGTARVVQPGDMTSVIHEVGHALRDAVMGTDESPFKGDNRPRVDDLERLGKMASPDLVPSNGYLDEGWAHFTQMWTTQHEDLMHLAPQMTEWMDHEYLPKHPDIAKALDLARDKADAWRMQGDLKRLTGSGVQPKTTLQRIAAKLQWARARNLNQQWLSAFAVATRFEDAKAKLGKPTPQDQRVDEIMRYVASAADSRARTFATEGTTTLSGTPTGESLKQALAPIKGNGPALFQYQLAKVTEWRLTNKTALNPEGVGPPVEGEKGVRVQTPHTTGPSLVDAQGATVKLEAKFPQIAEADARVRAWRDRVNDYIAECDPLIRHALDNMRQSDEYYLHVAAAFDEPLGPRNFARSGASMVPNKFGEELSERGNTRPVKNFVEVMQRDARRLMALGHQRLVINAAVNDAAGAGFGSLHEDLTKTLTGTGDGIKIGTELAATDASTAAIDAFFSRPTIDDASRTVIKYARLAEREDGTPYVKMEAHALNPEFHQSLSELDPYTTRQGMKALRVFAAYGKLGIVAGGVAIDPKYALYKGITWSAQLAFLNTRYAGVRTLMWDMPQALVRAGVHYATFGKIPDEYAKLVTQLGIPDVAQFQSERVVQQRTSNLIDTPGQRFATFIKTPADWLGLLDRMYAGLANTASIPGRSVRTAELKLAADKVNWKPGEPISMAQSMEMMRAYKTINGDSTEAGQTANQINRYVAFHRAAFVIPRDAYRAAARNPIKLVIIAGGANAANLLARYLTKDDAGVDSQNADESVAYRSFPVNVGNLKEAVRIPIERVWRLLLAPSDFVFNHYMAHEPMKARDIAIALAKGAAPPLVPNIIEDPINQLANRRNALVPGSGEIVSKGDEMAKYDPATKRFVPNHGAEVGPYTGKLSALLGSMTGVSPRRIDQALTDIGADVGRNIGDELGLGQDPKKEKDLSDRWLTGMWLRPGGAVNKQSRWESELFDLARVASASVNDPTNRGGSESGVTRTAIMEITDAIVKAHAIADTYTMKESDRQKIRTEANTWARDFMIRYKAGAVNPGPPRMLSLQQGAQLKMLEAQRGDTPKKLR